MHRSRRFIATFVLGLVCWLPTAHADVRLPRVIGSNMVLQRNAALPIWGWADPGEQVTVNISGNAATTTADGNGDWSLRLSPMSAGGPHQMTVQGQNELVLENILIGEVWVCSGQSNMHWGVRQSDDADAEIAAADFPNIRLFHIPRVPAGTPQDDVEADWSQCTPETVPTFSAVAYFFGRKLHQDVGVPIGLIETAWGGTRIEPWTTLDGFRSSPEVASLADESEAKHAAYVESLASLAEGAEQPKHPLEDRQAPTGLYNGMVHPIVPFAMRGAIWYQGESNRADGPLYRHKMTALINGWRRVWNQGEFPFLFVQLAPFRYDGDPEMLPRIWEAQAQSLWVPNTGMAVITDIGDVDDIHPTNKQEVGRRLALWALAQTYGQTGVTYSGPQYKGMSVEGNRIRIQFKQSAEGLQSSDGEPLTWFSIAGANGEFVEAQAAIEGHTVVVHSDQVAQPVSVRFGWNQEAEPNLVNSAGLPASPFRTHKW